MLKFCDRCQIEWETEESPLCPECDSRPENPLNEYSFDPGSYEDHFRGDR